mmetsp:Transcript_148178/g.258996  ORF Transcript_148178/g.258996 Transcript_148178/m.258996 type:complete len:240 (+) Transcript_148178:915-1634(+)
MVLVLELHNLVPQVGDLRLAPLVVHQQIISPYHWHLLPHLEVVVHQHVPVPLDMAQPVSVLCQLLLRLLQLLLERSILPLDELQLLFHVRQGVDCGGGLLAQLQQVLVPLFDLLVEGRVLNLQLLEVDQVQSIRQLFLLLQEVAKLLHLVPHLDVIDPHIPDLLVLLFLLFLVSINFVCRDCLTSTDKLGFKALLLFELLEFGLKLVRFIEMGLQFCTILFNALLIGLLDCLHVSPLLT